MYMTLHGIFIHRSDQTLTLTIGNSRWKLTLQRGGSVRKSTGMWRLTSLCSDKSAMKVKLPGWQNGGLHRLASQWNLCNYMNLSKTCKYSKSLTNTLKTCRKEEECYVTKSEKIQQKRVKVCDIWIMTPFFPPSTSISSSVGWKLCFTLDILDETDQSLRKIWTLDTESRRIRNSENL